MSATTFPVFFIQDAIKFPDLVHAVKPEADRIIPQAATAHDTFWDFVSLVPESMHMVMWAMSDRTLPRSFRMMEGFGVHTFRLVNADDGVSFVKFHWKPGKACNRQSGTRRSRSLAPIRISTAATCGRPSRGRFPGMGLGIQTFDKACADPQPYDVLDATKLIPEEDSRCRSSARCLDRNPDNFFAETEQVAFLPTNVPPGIDFTDDPLLQGRLFTYLDTQKSRLGTTNFHQIPINAPKCPMHNFQRDGMMQTQVPKGRANYEPNGLNQAGEETGPRADEEGVQTVEALNELGNDPDQKLRVRAEMFADHYSQARLFYRSQNPDEQNHMAAALVFELSKCELDHVRVRAMPTAQRGRRSGPPRRRRACMDLPAPADAARPPVEIGVSDALSILKQPVPAPKGRKLGILVTDGADGSVVKALKSAAESAGAVAMIISPKIGGPVLADGTQTAADGQLAGTPSVLLDAVAVVASDAGGADLAKMKPAIDFVSDAFAHLEAIATTSAAQPLLDKAGVAKDAFVLDATDADKLVSLLADRNWDREPQVFPPM